MCKRNYNNCGQALAELKQANPEIWDTGQIAKGASQAFSAGGKLSPSGRERVVGVIDSDAEIREVLEIPKRKDYKSKALPARKAAASQAFSVNESKKEAAVAKIIATAGQGSSSTLKSKQMVLQAAESLLFGQANQLLNMPLVPGQQVKLHQPPKETLYPVPIRPLAGSP